MKVKKSAKAIEAEVRLKLGVGTKELDEVDQVILEVMKKVDGKKAKFRLSK